MTSRKLEAAQNKLVQKNKESGSLKKIDAKVLESESTNGQSVVEIEKLCDDFVAGLKKVIFEKENEIQDLTQKLDDCEARIAQQDERIRFLEKELAKYIL